MFTLAMGYDNFWLAFAGEALHGLGSGTVVVGMRSVVSKFFLENELTFALVRRVGLAKHLVAVAVAVAVMFVVFVVVVVVLSCVLCTWYTLGVQPTFAF